jgi:polyferredoxin
MVLYIDFKNWEKTTLFNYGTAILIGLAIIVLILFEWGPESFLKNLLSGRTGTGFLSLFRTTTYSATELNLPLERF